MGFFDKIKEGLKKTSNAVSESIGDVFATFVKVDEDLLEELEEAMILADLGVSTASEAVDQLRDRAKHERISTQEELRAALKDILCDMMQEDTGLTMETTPSVVLVIGVNGVGKTTTIGKMAASFAAEGKRVMLAAADTFRAAAADQLSIWAERSGADIVRHQEGADPAAVVFDAIAAAKARGCDVILVDTAGRLHNKANLMNELNKIDRVITRELPDASRETLLVLDATTGQNAVSQAEQFNKAAKLTGIVLTKLDGTAKGGIVIAISAGLGVPVKYVGVGEGIDDLMPFEREAFVEALLPGNEESQED
jgi:fused signal recognition particle receptor